MPAIDITLPKGVFDAEQQARLAEQLTHDLMQCDVSRDNPRAANIIWTAFHETTGVYVAGKPTAKPHYRVDILLLEGAMDDGTRAKVVEAMTRHLLAMEGSAYNPLNAGRVWVLFHQLPDGRWGGGGRLYTLAELTTFLEQGRQA